MQSACPCCSGKPYVDCCGPFHDGIAVAPTAERLMRSRYSAFALGHREYLLQTWHPSSRPSSITLDPKVRWAGLEIVTRSGGGLLENRGTVEFRAKYRRGAVHGQQHENSSFVRERGRWFYLGIAEDRQGPRSPT